MGLDNPVWAPAVLAEDVSAQLAVAAVEEKRWEAEKQARLDAAGGPWRGLVAARVGDLQITVASLICWCLQNLAELCSMAVPSLLELS